MYLVGLSQYVQTGSSTSLPIPIVCGVPQESVLGPLVPSVHRPWPPTWFCWIGLTVLAHICTQMIHRSAGLAGRLCHWSSRTPSPAVLIMLPGGCVPTGSSWTLRRLRSCGLLLVIVLINCRSHHFELALTKLCQLLSFVISMRLHVTKTVSACVAILRSVCWSVVRRSVLQSLVTSLVLTRLDHENANLAVPAEVASVGDELWCSAGVFLIQAVTSHFSQ